MLGERMEDRIYKVYMHINMKNRKIYIGITKRSLKKRFGYNGNGYRNCKLFYKAIQKYGWNNFRHEIVLQNLTKDEAEMFEIAMIKYYNSNKSKFGYNIQNGGNTIGRIAQSTKNKISKAHKGVKLSEEHKRHIGENNPDKKEVICIETKEIFNSITLASKYFNIPVTTIVAICKNKRHSANDTHFAYLKDYLENKEKYIHLKKYINKNVICLNTGKIYNSAKEASYLLNVNTTSIRMCCKGRYKCAGGYNWMYLEDYNRYGFSGKLQRNKNFAKEVRCIETNVVFKNLTEAAKSIGLTASTIKAMLTGRLKTAGRYHWEYLDNNTD